VTSTPLSDAAARFREGAMPDSPLMRATEFGRRVRVESRGIPEYHPPLFPEEGFEYLMAVLRLRIKEHWDAVIVIDGPEGVGKSSLALRISGALDPTFTVSRICYTGADVMARFRDTLPGQVVLFDESARDLLGANSQTPEAKALAQALMLIRERGLVTILCIPRIHELAPSMRARRATYWLHCERRGLARVHRRSDNLVYKPDPRDLGFRLDPRAPMLTWKAYPAKSKLWQAYLRVKQSHLSEYLDETAMLLARRRGITKPLEPRPAGKVGRPRLLHPKASTLKRRARAERSAELEREN
jgi:hypothetical protein